jgi:hypothetical protein
VAGHGFPHLRNLLSPLREWTATKLDIAFLSALGGIILVSGLLELSLGLAGLAIVMWVTLPWAFLDRVEKINFPRRDHVHQVLHFSSRMFFVSGVWFTVVSVLEVTGILSTTVTANGVTTTSEILLSPFLGAGIISLAVAFISAYYVVESITSFRGAIRVTVLGATIEASVTFLMLIEAGLYLSLLYFLLPALKSVTILTWFVWSLPVGIAFAVATLAFMVWGKGRTTIVAYCASTLPVWVAVILGLLIEVGLVK